LRVYLWTAMQFVRQFSRRESLSNGAGEFRAPEKKAVPFWPFVVRNGPSWNLGMRTVVWVEYSPQVSMERQTYILFPLLALNFRSFSRVKKCYDVSRRALFCGGGGRLSDILVNFGPTYHSIIITSRTHTVNGQSLYNVAAFPCQFKTNPCLSGLRAPRLSASGRKDLSSPAKTTEQTKL
jgi:hypothetical protein